MEYTLVGRRYGGTWDSFLDKNIELLVSIVTTALANVIKSSIVSKLPGASGSVVSQIVDAIIDKVDDIAADYVKTKKTEIKKKVKTKFSNQESVEDDELEFATANVMTAGTSKLLKEVLVAVFMSFIVPSLIDYIVKFLLGNKELKSKVNKKAGSNIYDSVIRSMDDKTKITYEMKKDENKFYMEDTDTAIVQSSDESSDIENIKKTSKVISIMAVNGLKNILRDSKVLQNRLKNSQHKNIADMIIEGVSAYLIAYAEEYIDEHADQIHDRAQKLLANKHVQIFLKVAQHAKKSPKKDITSNVLARASMPLMTKEGKQALVDSVTYQLVESIKDGILNKSKELDTIIHNNNLDISILNDLRKILTT